MNQVIINVTKEDINSGDCPVTRAIKQNFPYSKVEVGATNVYLGGEVVGLPIEVQNWLDKHDLGRTVDPISFELWV